MGGLEGKEFLERFFEIDELDFDGADAAGDGDGIEACLGDLEGRDLAGLGAGFEEGDDFVVERDEFFEEIVLFFGGDKCDGVLGDLFGEGAAGFSEFGFGEDDLDASEFSLVFES